MPSMNLHRRIPFLSSRNVPRAARTRPAAVLLGIVALTVLAGCATPLPEKQVLPQQDIARAQLAADIHLVRDGWPAAQWWTQYQDPQLDTLITQALKSGPSLQVAAMRIEAAGANVSASRSEGGLSTSFEGAGNRQRYSGNGLFPPPIGGNYFNEATLQLRARYDFDWWGRHRAQIAAAVGEENARRAELAEAENILGAAIAQSYFTLQGAWARRDLLQKSIALQKALVQDRVRRVANGLAAIDLQRLAEEDLASQTREQVQLDTRIAIERESLRALIGADADGLPALQPRPISEVPHAMPAHLGMELLARRPDLQAARWRVEAALSRVEAARAAFYPDINLAASAGLDSLTLGDLFTLGSRTLFVGPAISLPLFNSGRLNAGLEASRAARNAMIADYNQSVFDAVRDVAQRGIALRGLEQEISRQQEALQASDALLRSAQKKFDRGLTDRGTLLAAELTQMRQRDIALQLASQQRLAEVALDKALGGGYRNDSGAAATASNRSTVPAVTPAGTPPAAAPPAASPEAPFVMPSAPTAVVQESAPSAAPMRNDRAAALPARASLDHTSSQNIQ